MAQSAIDLHTACIDVQLIEDITDERERLRVLALPVDEQALDCDVLFADLLTLHEVNNLTTFLGEVDEI